MLSTVDALATGANRDRRGHERSDVCMLEASVRREPSDRGVRQLTVRHAHLVGESQWRLRERSSLLRARIEARELIFLADNPEFWLHPHVAQERIVLA